MDSELHGGLQVFEREITVADRVEAVGDDAREAEPLRERAPVVDERRAGDRAGAEGHAVGCLGCRLEALLVARERLDVRHPPVTEQHRLCGLEVRVGGHRDRAGGACLPDERALELAHALDRRAHVQAQIGRHLVVAAAPGVEPPRRVAAARDELRLDRRVHVFPLELHGARREIGFERVARGEQLLERVGVQHAAFAQRLRVGAREHQLLGPEALVEHERVVQRPRAWIEAFGDPAEPEGLRVRHATPRSRAHRAARRWRAAGRTA